MNKTQHRKNKHRELPLTAIGKARYLALLIMGVYSNSMSFKSYAGFAYDREFYAQVENGNIFPIPHDSSVQFLHILGLKHHVQLRNLRRLLRLPNMVWDWADDLSWTENFIIQQLFTESTNELELVTQAVNYAFAENYFEDFSVDALLPYQQLLLAKTPAEVKTILVERRDFKRLVIASKKAILLMDDEDRQATIDYMRNMISELEKQ